MYAANLSVLMPTTPDQPAVAPTLVVTGPVRPFPELLAAMAPGRSAVVPPVAQTPIAGAQVPAEGRLFAGTGAPAAGAADQDAAGLEAGTGNFLPEPAEPAGEAGSLLPVILTHPMPAAPPVAPVPTDSIRPEGDTAVAGPARPGSSAAGPVQAASQPVAQIVPQTVPQPVPSVLLAAPMPQLEPRGAGATSAAPVPAAAMALQPAAGPTPALPGQPGTELPGVEPGPGPADAKGARDAGTPPEETSPPVSSPARTAEAAAAPSVLRDLPAAPAAAAAAPSAQPREPLPGEQLERLVEVLAHAREAGKGARSDLLVRHGEFGTVAIRIDQGDGELRATLTARDPGLAPAIVAALAERGATQTHDQPQRGNDNAGQSGGHAAQGQTQSGQGEHRQPGQRHAEPRAAQAHDNARNSPDHERDGAPAGSEDRSGHSSGSAGRFA